MSKNKRFGASGLNALNSAVNTVSEAVAKSNEAVMNEEVSVEAPMEPLKNHENTESANDASLSPEPEMAEKEKAEEPVEPKAPRKATRKSKKTAAGSGEQTVGVNIMLPMEAYSRLQSLRAEKGLVPLRTLCLNIVLEYLDKKSKS